MPAALDIDWSAIKMLVLSMGVRPAIRSLGLEGTSTEEAIRKRAQREDWLGSIPRNQPVPATVARHVPYVPKTASEALVDVYKDQRIRTRLALSTATQKASDALAEKSAPDLLADGGTTLKTVAQTASLVHGWAEQTQSRVVVNIGALSEASEAMSIEMEAPPIEPEVEDDPFL